MAASGGLAGNDRQPGLASPATGGRRLSCHERRRQPAADHRAGLPQHRAAGAHHPVLVRHWRGTTGRAEPQGHRLYDARSLARLELVRSLRELGLGLEEVRRVLERQVTVADAATAQLAAIDARIRSLQLTGPC